MQYDNILTKTFGEEIDTTYGMFEGNNTVLFIKVGQDGNIYGYENKYLTIAQKMNKKYGYSVIVCSNPFNGKNPLDQDMAIVGTYAKEKGFNTYEVHYLGHSNGALIGLRWGHLYPEIKRFLLVNAPLMINWHRSKKSLAQSTGQHVSFVYGKKDPSFPFVGYLTPFIEANNSMQLVTIEEADHNFTGLLDEFISLPLTYFTKEK